MGSSGSGGRVHRPRREATIVRFQAERLASGLYRHRAVKFIMMMKGEQTGVRWR
ncbi:MAG: hypothetical protein ACYTDU_10345 [Planctomycetota bacterium]|jgi:hypothetical protein